MGPKEFKSTLKEAKELIKIKDFKTAIEKCKEILVWDAKNYMALVFLGACYQETNKKEAAKYLRDAASTNEEPTVALQGLLNCAEPDELPDILKQLLTLVPEKYNEYHKRLVASINDKTTDKCFEILKSETLIENDPNRVQSAYKSLSSIFIKNPGKAEIDENLYKKSLEAGLDNDNRETQLECFKKYLKLLYKLKEFEILLRNADNMLEKFPTEIYSLEWICKLYGDFYESTEIDVLSFVNHPIEYYEEKILKLNEKSSLGKQIKGIKLFEEKQFVQARDRLLEVQNIQPNLLTVHKLLAKCNIALGAFVIASESLKLLDREKESLEMGKCLSYDVEDTDSLKNSLEILKKYENSEFEDRKIEALYYMGRIYHNLSENFNYANCLQKLKDFDKNHAMLLEAEFETPETSLKILEEILEFQFEVSLLKGRKYFDLQQFDKSLKCLLQAAKERPFYSECFEWLGQVYSGINDWTRARKCFEKCITLNPQNQKIITRLSAIYRKNQEWDLNYALLQNSSKYFIGSKKSKWAYFQMGLHGLSLKKADEAINSFRLALRCDSADAISWEGLADAYYLRGSYNSAMKAYQKVIEFNPKNPYPKLQIAHLKTLLRMHVEAIKGFDELLSEHSDYLPALKGAAEAHYGLARQSLNERLLGRCKEHLQSAADFLQRAFIVGKRDVVWLWHLMAKVFDLAASLPASKSFLNVRGKLAGQETEIVTLREEELCQFSEGFYRCALKLNEDDPILWHELAACYFNHTKYYGNAEKNKKLLTSATEAIKCGIKLKPNCWQNWNLLGVICAQKEISELPLAQHCFIKALNIDKNSAVTWTNLGVLYLQLNYIELANKAFGRAQQSDTDFVNAWIGQAIVAERIGEIDEAIDLFRHCTQLKFHLESAIGYAHLICSLLSDPENMKDAKHQYVIETMHAVTIAFDSMTWYLNAEEGNACVEALSYLGYLSDRQRLRNGAIKAFQEATKATDPKIKDKMFCNLGFAYLKGRKPLKAIEAFNSVAEATFKSTIGLALAYFRSKKFEDAYNVYSSAFEWLADNDNEKALVLVAMSSIVYRAGDEAEAKTTLLQCIASPNPPIEAIFAACSLGIIHRDYSLAKVVLDVLKQYENDFEHCHHVAFLTSQFYSNTKEIKQGLVYLTSRIHIHPDRPLLRELLANYIIRNCEKSQVKLEAGSRIALSSVALNLKDFGKHKINSFNAAHFIAVASESMKFADQRKRFKLAQRAVHVHPICPEAWIAIAICKNHMMIQFALT